jgi:hypothetical protein
MLSNCPSAQVSAVTVIPAWPIALQQRFEVGAGPA